MKIDDPYKTLKVKKTVTKESIKKAYHKRARETHPDRNGDKQEFEKVHQAYLVLSDPIKRDQYDRTGEVDEKNIDNTQSEMMELLGGVFISVISQLIGSGKKVKNVDIISNMRKSIESNKQTIKQLKDTTNNARESLQEVIERLSVDGAPNYIEQLARHQLSLIDRQTEQADKEIENMDMVLTHLAKCKFRFEESGVKYQTIQEVLGIQLNAGLYTHWRQA